ncbi:putative ATPase [Antricoccus suffuscus]|uniref:Putative ATPase n=1 Tax=Antricoccus suffuscus TaxID=1629062 RepID=A0A2T1A1V2_9ACTN|nr:BTAD domain-containing putative transcriptional regulator [Antricoccus suffuscus]PRZ42589.1 putative ATPase [Antricoccus suffuscus]
MVNRAGSQLVKVGVLGPLSVQTMSGACDIPGVRLRRLLMRMAMAGGGSVTADRLIDAVWSGDLPANATSSLQSLISRLRKAVGDGGAISQTAAGYGLVDVQLDVVEFEELVRDGRQQLRGGQFESAATTLDMALALVRGTPYAEAADLHWALPEIARLEDLRRDAIGDWSEAKLATGQASETVARLEAVTRDVPLDERFAGLLMRGYAATGRTAEALARYETTRRKIAEELGSDPSRELQDLHLQLLTADDPPPERSESDIPAAVTSFIGRQREIERVTDLIEANRLVTIIGPGGAGKTRTSFEVARRLSAQGAKVRLVELAKTTVGDNLEQAFVRDLDLARASHTRARDDRMALDGKALLVNALSDDQCVLIVDNCEHVIGAAAGLIAELLARCPALRIIATSREALAIDGESLCSLSSLDLPPADSELEAARGFSAVRLFIDRARAASASFVADERTMPAIVEIVRRLDGLPLAIELAAARLRVLPVDAIAQGLGDRFRLLVGGSRTAMSRHRTLLAVVEWSWELLTPEERYVLEWLSVYPGGFAAQTAAKVCASGKVAALDVPEILNALVDKSLLIVTDGHTIRYRMLETIREYGTARLIEAGTVQQARARHARHFLVFAQRNSMNVDANDQSVALRLFNEEYDNFVAAMTFYIELGDSGRAIALCLHLAWFWMVLGRDEELGYWTALAAEVPTSNPSAHWHVARGLGVISQMSRQFTATGAADPGFDRDDGIADIAQVAANLRRYLADGPIEVAATLMLLLFFTRQYNEAEQVADDALLRATPLARGRLRLMRAAFAENFGDLESLRTHVALALDELDTTSDQWGRAQAITSRSYVRMLDGDFDGAIADVQEARAISGRLGAVDDQIYMGARQVGMLIASGRVDDAVRCLDEIEMLFDNSRGTPMWKVILLIQRMIVEDARGNQAFVTSAVRQVRSMLDEFEGAGTRTNHMIVVGAGSVAIFELEAGELSAGYEDAVRAFVASKEVDDFPILASIGVVSAILAAEFDDYAHVAELLGASQRLRGSADPSNLREVRLYAEARARLGADFEVHHGRGLALSHDEAYDRLDPRYFEDAIARRVAERTGQPRIASAKASSSRGTSGPAG